jgi:hypothetical protein
MLGVALAGGNELGELTPAVGQRRGGVRRLVLVGLITQVVIGTEVRPVLLGAAALVGAIRMRALGVHGLAGPARQMHLVPH